MFDTIILLRKTIIQGVSLSIALIKSSALLAAGSDGLASASASPSKIQIGNGSLFSLIKIILASLTGIKPISIVLFGSQIDEKNARPDSDFDILCIIPNETNLKRFKNEIAQSETQIEKRFGNRASLLIMKKSEFFKRKEKSDQLLFNIEKKSQLLFGKHLREIK